MGRQTITLDNFDEFRGEVNGVLMAANLPMEPYVPSDEIHVDLGRIATAARIGHLRLVLFERYSEQDSISAGVDSVGDDGSATAAFSASATRAPRINAESLTPGEPTFHKGGGGIRINLGHSDLDEANLREAEPWAKHLDASIREGMRACTSKKLFKNNRAYRVGAFMFNAAFLGTVLTLSGVEPSNLNGIAEMGVGSAVGYNARNVTGKVFQGLQPEYSLIPYIPLDRMGLVHAYTHTRKFVKAK
jgi:hypothetical protein